jgi:mRNA interferase RelE/StbE
VAWRIRFSKEADKSLRKLDRQVSARILDELEEVSRLDDPRTRGKALVGNLAGLWRYRVGDYRVVCDIEDEVLVILVVGVAHRSSVYRRR